MGDATPQSREIVDMTVIGSLTDLHDVLQDLKQVDAIFRGEDSTSYALKPKIGRVQTDGHRISVESEAEMLAAFKRRAVAYLESPPDRGHNWRWLTIAQHFGLATRMLDWTENPLAAVYFAVKDSSWKDRVLYICDKSQVKFARTEEIGPFEIEVPFVYEPPHISQRITAQDAILTAHPAPAQSFSHEALDQVVIEGSARKELGSYLREVGVTARTLFPDLEGLARSHNATWVEVDPEAPESIAGMDSIPGLPGFGERESLEGSSD